MANTQILKRRIRSVKSTRQITKAMELVAASKLRRAQIAADQSKAYAQTALKIMADIAAGGDVAAQTLLTGDPHNKTVLYVVFGSDRGLAGALNSNVIGQSIKAIQEDQKAGKQVNVITMGRRVTNHFARIKDLNLSASYEALGDSPDPEVFAPLINTILGTSGQKYGSVKIVYTAFTSTLSQKVQTETLLPVVFSDENTERKSISYEFEPSPEEVLAQAIQLYTDARITQAYVESTASEHAMRMIAMNNATKSAGDLIDDLTLELNSRRQAGITQEIAEITSGAEAVK